jgi:acyl-CoA thioester hydrolase
MSFPEPRCSVEFRVRYAETDQMGFAHHSNHLVWCEIGRTDLIRRLYRSYAEIEREGVLLAVSDASVRYHASARYDDLVRVDTSVESVRSRQVTFAYLISRVNDDGSATRLASARTTLIALDAAGAPRTLPPAILQSFRAATAPEPVEAA